MKYTIADIARIIDAETKATSAITIDNILLDSRKVYEPSVTLFFALKGPRRDGHQFIPELYKRGVRSFVICEPIDQTDCPDAIFLDVYDSLVALQMLMAHHRRQFDIPVIGITGSNGKTIIKEWLFQLLNEDFNIVRSPKSYNSQIGVPLSIWPMNEQHTLGIFEAGISEQGEMLRLERMIQPTIGILSNIGEAHSEGFIDADHKFREKAILFRHCHTVIGRSEDFANRKEVLDMLGDELRILTWGDTAADHFLIRSVTKSDRSAEVSLTCLEGDVEFMIPFTDDASVENAIHCCCLMLQLGVNPSLISQRMKRLHPVNMRLELKKGINQCIVINDSYSTDISSLEIALGFLEQQSAGIRKTVILSDFLQSALPDEALYELVAEKLIRHKVNKLIAIGDKISSTLSLFLSGPDISEVSYYKNTQEFTESFRHSQFRDEAILVKGARVFAFERIVQLLELKAHQTVLEINLSAIAHNLKQYQQLIQPQTRIMAMVKAFAYGSGGAEIAGILQYHKADYLAVAYTDEGVELRKAGIRLPVMVMNPDESSFDLLTSNRLEPELYSIEMLQAFDLYLRQEGIQQYPIHIEIETGMNRLGIAVADMERLAGLLLSTSSFSLQTVFSHLAASEEAANDDFSKQQFTLFQQAADELQQRTGYPFLRHIANSAAAVRHPAMQLDMIRLGIGLYGVDSARSGQLSLQTVATLKSSIAQLKRVSIGESVSYNRKGILTHDALIATIRLGYADGYPRRLGNGAGKVLIRGKEAPVIGTVCMDMFMVDVTGLPEVKEGDEVIIFGPQMAVEAVAAAAGTIPYEIMTGISQRVRRVYYQE